MPTVHLPLHAIRHRQIGGVENAIYNLSLGLAESAELRLSHSAEDALAPAFRAAMATAGVPIDYRPKMVKPPQADRYLQEARAVAEGRAELTILPNYFHPPFRARRGVTGTIVHDCQFLTYPGYFGFKKRSFLKWAYAATARFSDIVFFLSEKEREAFLQRYPAARIERMRVIGNAVDLTRFDDRDLALAGTLGAERYLLAVNYPYPHKRVDRLIAAFAEAAARDPDLRLKLIGKRSALSDAAVALLPEGVAKRVDALGFVSDMALGEYYRHAAAFVTTSEYEGFCLPAVEALALGTAVVAPHSTAFPEVTQGFATLVRPEASAGEWADAFTQALAAPRGADTVEEAMAAMRRRYAPRYVAQLVLEPVAGARKPPK